MTHTHTHTHTLINKETQALHSQPAGEIVPETRPPVAVTQERDARVGNVIQSNCMEYSILVTDTDTANCLQVYVARCPPP